MRLTLHAFLLFLRADSVVQLAMSSMYVPEPVMSLSIKPDLGAKAQVIILYNVIPMPYVVVADGCSVIVLNLTYLSIALII